MKKIVIIGNSAAAIGAIEEIRRHDQDCALTVITEEPYPAYCRCLITDFLSGKLKEEKIWLRDSQFYSQNKVELQLSKKAVRIDEKKKKVVFADKTTLGYDQLLIATGASPTFPDIKGIKKHGVFGFRTLEDVKTMLELVPLSEGACVLGGGLIGLKAAYALKKRGLEVKVIVKSNQVLSQVLDEAAASLFTQRFIDNGIEIVTGTDVTEVLGNGDVKAVRLDTGKVLACNLVVVGKGVSPNMGLLKETAIQIDQGILVDKAMATNIPDIYAAGDVCQAYDPVLGKPAVNALWPNAIAQGRVAGSALAGGDLSYGGWIGMNSVEFFDLPMVSIGEVRFKDKKGIQELVEKKENPPRYKKLVFKEGFLIGAVLVGNLAQAGVYFRLVRERINLAGREEELLEPAFSYAVIKDTVEKEDKAYFFSQASSMEGRNV